MALTFTIISFTCIAPFYGSFAALSATIHSAGDVVRLVLGALAFSVTFASPFFLLALFPSMLRTLPKSGGWMNTIKVVMGFLELAAAVKFLRAGELFFAAAHSLAQPSYLFTYDLSLGLYIALAVACGLYLLNLFRLPHDDPAEYVGVPRLLAGLVFLSLAVYLLPGLFNADNDPNRRPKGTLFEWIDSFLLDRSKDQLEEESVPPAVAGKGAAEKPKGTAALSWIPLLEDGLREAREQHKRVFIDFTGIT
jgi:thiol:disulfide interchange protein DsbD